MKKSAATWGLRIAAGAIIALSLTGPAPGNVGGCGGDSSVADARQFCTDREFWECRRDHFAGRIDDATFSTCVNAIESGCSAFAWPASCFPTPGETQACLVLLQRTDLSNMSTPDLLATYTDCNLCM